MQRQILQETKLSMLNIQQSMKEMLREAESWKMAEIDKLNNIKTSHSKNLDKIELQIQSINNKIEVAKERHDIIKMEESREKETEVKLEKVLDELKEESSRLPNSTKPIEEQIQKCSQELESRQKNLELKLREMQRELETTSKGLSGFTSHSGMDIEMKDIDGKRFAQITFTRLDSKNPERRFSFCVRVRGNKKYEMEDCVPPLNTDHLLDDLNKSNNFQRFVVQMRQQFYNYVEQHSQ